MTDKTTTTTIPAGWKLVPRNPTEAMISAGLKTPICSVDPNSFARSAAFCQHQGMVEAAPAAPSPAPAAPSAAKTDAMTTCVTCQGFGSHAHPDDPHPLPCPDCNGSGAQPAQPDVGPNIAVQDVAQQVESRVNERGGEAAVDDIVALTIEVLWEMQRAAPAQPAQDSLTETAKETERHPNLTAFLRHLWRGAELRRLSVEDEFRDLYDDAIAGKLEARDLAALAVNEVRQSVDDPVDGLETLFKAIMADLSAARAAQPVVEVVEALRIAYDRLETIAAEDGRVGAIADLVRAYDAALRSGEGR
ncbi:hypothetical protein ACHMW5_13395 [Azospirillum melinis]|uniref:hypothetical protein n=1 Tax=Azospirillum melinis TaxID=328839 RepID=UPI003756FF35